MDTDYRSAEKKRSDNAAADLAAKQNTCAGLGGTYDGSKCVKNGKTVDMKTGAETRTTTDANGNNVSTTTLKTDDGTQVTTQTTTTADGQTSTVTVTKNADGSTTTTVTEGGKTTTLKKDSDGTQTVNNNPSKAEQECREAKGGRWDPEKKECIGASRVSQNELDCKQEGGTWNGKQCNNPKREDCESKGGTWVADGAKSHCIELSKEEQCRRKTDGSVWDAKENKCLSPKDLEELQKRLNKDGDKETPDNCGSTAEWNGVKCECLDNTQIYSHTSHACVDPNTGKVQTKEALDAKQAAQAKREAREAEEASKKKSECKPPRQWVEFSGSCECLKGKYNEKKNKCCEEGWDSNGNIRYFCD